MAESSSKDPIIIRKVSAVSLGQAISVVGAYKSEATEETPQAKKLPEPILPSTQPKYNPYIKTQSLKFATFVRFFFFS